METNVNERIRIVRELLKGRNRRRGAEGVTLVEVMIVVAILAVIAGGATIFAFPMLKEARIKTAVQSASTIKEAAKLYQELDNTGEGCPTLQDLISSKRVEAKKTEDPWGKPFAIKCAEGEIHVVSGGNDRKEGTPDDVRDDFSAADIKRVKDL